MYQRFTTIGLYAALCVPLTAQTPTPSSPAELERAVRERPPVCVERNTETGIERLCQGYERRIDISLPFGNLLKKLFHHAPRTTEVVVQQYRIGAFPVRAVGMVFAWGEPYRPTVPARVQEARPVLRTRPDVSDSSAPVPSVPRAASPSTQQPSAQKPTTEPVADESNYR